MKRKQGGEGRKEKGFQDHLKVKKGKFEKLSPWRQ